METCSQAFWLADIANDLGHEVRVVPATLVKQIGVGARGTKTDKRDARVLSEVSCRIDLPSVHIRRGYSSKFTGRVRDKLLGLPDGMPVFVERLLQTVESLSEDIDGATKEILARVRKASWTAWRTRPEDPMVRWARGVADRRGRRVAITGLARRMVGVLYAVWRDGTAYDGGRMLRDRGLMHEE